MQLDGAQTIAADRMTVWRAINDPEILKACIPGCQEMTKVSPTEFEAVVIQKIGPVKATFEGTVTLKDVIEGESLTLSGEGKAGVAGMAKGDARVRLTDAAGGTELSYDAEASVAGKIAQLGSRLIDGVARKMADQFFARLKEEVEGDGAAAASATSGAASAAVASAAGTEATASASASAFSDPGEPDLADIDAGSVQQHTTTADDVWQNAQDVATHGRGVAPQDTAAGLDQGAVETVAERAGAKMGDAAREAAETVETAIVEADKRLAGAVAQARNAASGSDPSAEQAAREVETAASATQDSIAASIARAKEILAGGIDGAQDTATDLGTEARDAVGKVAKDVADTVGQALDTASDRIGAAIARAREAVAEANATSVGGAMEAADRAIAEGASDAQKAVAGIETEAVTAAQTGAADTGAATDHSRGAATAAAGGVAAAVSGLAAQASARLDQLHERARTAVIAAGKDVDEAAEWRTARDHAGRAVDDAGDALEDAWDAAKAKAQGASDVAAREWDEAKEGLSKAASAGSAAASSAWTAAKGAAAEEAQNPRMGPKGKPWYIWIILAVVALVLFSIIF